MTHHQQWHLGKVRVSAIHEMHLNAAIMARLIPDASAEQLLELNWLKPDFIDAEGNMRGAIQALLVETPTHRIVVDTCVGNDKSRKNPDFNQLRTGFLADLEALGVTRESVDTVLCTHLHIDHVGWNTMLVDGEWVPTFPNARYLFGKQEFEHWQSPDHGALERLDVEAVLADSVQPVIDAGLADFVATDHRICAEVRLVPTPGHTPGHVSVLIESEGSRALITGDVVHHPCQFANPHWPSSPDSEPELNLATRKQLIAEHVNRDTLVIGTHFAAPVAGHLKDDASGVRFVTAPGNGNV